METRTESGREGSLFTDAGGGLQNPRQLWDQGSKDAGTPYLGTAPRWPHPAPPSPRLTEERVRLTRLAHLWSEKCTLPGQGFAGKMVG